MIELDINGVALEIDDKVRYWWVNQGSTFELDSNLNRISCREDAIGKYHKSLCETKIGDIILHYSKGYIKAISIVTKECYYQNSRRINNSKYYLLKDPISKDYIIKTVDKLPRPPFNYVNNGIQQSYLFSIEKDFFEKLFKNH